MYKKIVVPLVEKCHHRTTRIIIQTTIRRHIRTSTEVLPSLTLAAFRGRCRLQMRSPVASHSPHRPDSQTRMVERHHENLWPSPRPSEICALHNTPRCNVRKLGRCSNSLLSRLAKLRACVGTRPMQTANRPSSQAALRQKERSHVLRAILALQSELLQGRDNQCQETRR